MEYKCEVFSFSPTCDLIAAKQFNWISTQSSDTYLPDFRPQGTLGFYRTISLFRNESLDCWNQSDSPVYSVISTKECQTARRSIFSLSLRSLFAIPAQFGFIFFFPLLFCTVFSPCPNTVKQHKEIAREAESHISPCTLYLIIWIQSLYLHFIWRFISYSPST